MKLPSSVLNAVRGLGSATLIAAAVAGCGGAGQETRSDPQIVVRQDVRADRDNRNREPVPEEEPIAPPDYDVAVACGRG